MKFDSQTIVSLSLQARDWHYLAAYMKNDDSQEDLFFNLKQKFHVISPPTGTTLVEADNQYLGVLLELFYKCSKREGKEIGKGTRNRFRTALETLSLQEITDWLTEFDAEETAAENIISETGRRYLRGRMG